jgi:hypothetical protein
MKNLLQNVVKKNVIKNTVLNAFIKNLILYSLTNDRISQKHHIKQKHGFVIHAKISAVALSARVGRKPQKRRIRTAHLKNNLYSKHSQLNK